MKEIVFNMMQTENVENLVCDRLSLVISYIQSNVFCAVYIVPTRPDDAFF